METFLINKSEWDKDNNKNNGKPRLPEEISIALQKYLENNPNITEIITSVGIPILMPDGKTLIRGPFIRIPEVAGKVNVDIDNGDIDRWASKGWVDLRNKNISLWQKRFEMMQRGRQSMRGKGSAAVNRAAYLHEDIQIGEVVSWIFNNEIGGYRLM